MRKITALIAAAIVLLSAGSIYADNKLLPTDVLDPGRFFSDIRYGYTSLEGQIASSGMETDVEGGEHRINYVLRIGIANGFDVEASTSYLAEGSINWEADTFLGHVEMKTLEEGIDDTTVSFRFKLAEEGRDGVNFTFALIGVLPSGQRKEGEPEIHLDGVKLQDEKAGSPGNGVVSYGAGFSVSGRSGNFEPYLLGSYIFGGRRERHEIDEHYADQAQLQVGIQWHTSPHAAFDFSIMAVRNSPQAQEEDRSKTVSNSFIMGYAFIGMYFEFAPNATFILGAAYGLMESHVVNRSDGARMEGVSAFVPSIGLHLLF